MEFDSPFTAPRQDAPIDALLAAPVARIAPTQVAARITGLGRGRLLTLVGLEAAELRRLAVAESRPMLLLAASPASDPFARIGEVLDELAELALARWPAWSEATATHRLLAPWRRGAAKLAEAGLRPRFRHTPREVELTQLIGAIDPALVLVAAIDGLDPARAAATIVALDWCRAQGASLVVLCPARPPATPPYDRIAYGALEVARADDTVVSRLIVPPGKVKGSEIERRLREAVARDGELCDLFTHEVVLCPNPLGQAARVDMLWESGRVVVEIDGPEHCVDPKFSDDRHRDYELAVAGYLVLRLTNAQVQTDLWHALEKIRKVVRFRRERGLP